MVTRVIILYCFHSDFFFFFFLQEVSKVQLFYIQEVRETDTDRWLGRVKALEKAEP